MLESAGLPITISGVTKTYGAVYALDSFDLAIQQGENSPRPLRFRQNHDGARRVFTSRQRQY